MTKELKPLLLPKLAWVAENGDEPVGLALGVPDINVVLRDLNGRLTRFGFSDRSDQITVLQEAHPKGERGRSRRN